MPDLETARACAEHMLANDAASRSLGITVTIPSPAQAVASMQVRDDMLNGFGICHGGYIFTLADTAFAFACNAYDDLTVAASASIEYLQPVQINDRLQASAVEDLREGRRGFYTVRVTRSGGADSNEVVAIFRGRSASQSKPLIK